MVPVEAAVPPPPPPPPMCSAGVGAVVLVWAGGLCGASNAPIVSDYPSCNRSQTIATAYGTFYLP